MAYNYYFNVNTLYLIAGFSSMIVNDYTSPLSIAPVEEDGHFYFPVEDFKTTYSHVYDVEETGDSVLVKAPVRQASVEVKVIDGKKMLPLDTVLVSGFDYRRIDATTAEKRHVVIFTCNPLITEAPNLKLKLMDALVRGKREGDLYGLFWFEEDKKQVPYRIYLPTGYDTNKKYPVVFFLHGGNGNPSKGFEYSKNDLQYYGEKHGFIIVGVDGYIRDATFGYILPPNPGDPGLDDSCPENPAHYSEERIKGHKLGERCLERTIEVIQERYAVDPDRMFLMGNSMGGEGSFWFSSTHPGMFKAVSPAGAMINTKFVDLSTFMNIPYLFVAGTEDMHGFDYLQDGVETMEKYGVNIKHIYIGGGAHADAWCRAIPEIFDFFETFC